MALTSTVQLDQVPGAYRTVVASVTGDSSYPAGGYLLTPALFGLNSFAQQRGNIFFPVVLSGDMVSAQVKCDVDATGHLRVFYPSGGGAASPAALSAPAITSGSTAVTSAAANGTADLTPGQGKEVAAGTNLSTLVVLLEAYGS